VEYVIRHLHAHLQKLVLVLYVTCKIHVTVNFEDNLPAKFARMRLIYCVSEAICKLDAPAALVANIQHTRQSFLPQSMATAMNHSFSASQVENMNSMVLILNHRNLVEEAKVPCVGLNDTDCVIFINYSTVPQYNLKKMVKDHLFNYFGGRISRHYILLGPLLYHHAVSIVFESSPDATLSKFD